MLNPSKWQGSSSNTTAKSQVVAEAYSKHGEPDPTVFELGDEDDLLPPTAVSSSTNASKTTLAVPSSTTAPIPSASRLAMPSNGRSTSTTAAPSRAITPAPKETFESLQLLISLDTALELIHADREALKRVETFKRYPGRVGERVHETIEEVFIMLLQAMADRHIGPGFRLATEQMRTYKPAEHEEATSVAPLLQFFELVHVGDTIQSMVQVYFDKEMVGRQRITAAPPLPSYLPSHAYRSHTSTAPTSSTALSARRSGSRTSSTRPSPRVSMLG